MRETQMVDGTVVPLSRPAQARTSKPGRPEREPLLRQVFGDVLRQARLTQGRTLADVAGEAQVSTPYLSEVERGLKEASSEVLAAICRALDLRAVDLVARTHGQLSARGPQPLGAQQPGEERAVSTLPIVQRSPFRSHGSPVALAA
ncbi:MAG: helix-turn-helix transcriptional regulator [Propionibacteriaceae bacterium]